MCSCQRSSLASATPAVEQEAQGPRILFADLEITLDSLTQVKTVVLVNTLVAEGKLKKQVAEETEGAPGDIKCTLLNSRRQELYTAVIPNPLQKTFELSSESGEMQQKTIRSSSALFTLRAPFAPGASLLLVQQIQVTNRLEDLKLLNLPL